MSGVTLNDIVVGVASCAKPQGGDSGVCLSVGLSTVFLILGLYRFDFPGVPFLQISSALRDCLASFVIIFGLHFSRRFPYFRFWTKRRVWIAADKGGTSFGAIFWGLAFRLWLDGPASGHSLVRSCPLAASEGISLTRGTAAWCVCGGLGIPFFAGRDASSPAPRA